MKSISSVRIITVVAALALAALVQFSCDDNPTNTDQKLRIAAYAGNNQSERPGATLADPLVAKVTDILGTVKPGVSVSFTTQDAGAHAVPSTAVTNANGLASCAFQLGTSAGAQHVEATIADDSTSFSLTAVAAGCAEDGLAKLCDWPAKHIFVATTSSSLAIGSGTVIIDYDPVTKMVTKVLETTDLLDGMSFSSRGELFVSSPNKIRKVDHDALTLDDYITWADNYHISMDPNPGSVLAGLTITGPVKIDCPSSGVSYLLSAHTFSNNLKWQTVAVDPVTRDLYMISEFSPTNFALWRVYWDGRTPVQSFDVVANLSVGGGAPAGMCVDSTGTVYIVFDGNDNYRRIVSVTSAGAVNYNFFNFFTYYGSNSQQAGRWGDLAYLDGKLYVIDRRNDRLVIISKNGTWLDEVMVTAFSRQLVEDEHYSICASPGWACMAK